MKVLARPRSDEKREALVEAAIELFAERGALTTPTSAVSKYAGVAEGTLFTYFERKETLLNEVYLVLKGEVSDAILERSPATDDLKALTRHIWTKYVSWGLQNPTRFKVLRELGVSDKISAESRAAGYEPLEEMMSRAKSAIQRGEVRKLPLEYFFALLNGMVEGTVGFILDAGVSPKKTSAEGFEVFWSGISLVARGEEQ